MQHELSQWQLRHMGPADGRGPHPAWRHHWPWMALVAVTLLALLGGLTQVLLLSVQQGETLRSNTRLQGEAFWNCNSLGTAAERHACRHDSLQPAPAARSMPLAPTPMPPPRAQAPRLLL
jgi:hypothetical protein